MKAIKSVLLVVLLLSLAALACDLPELPFGNGNGNGNGNDNGNANVLFEDDFSNKNSGWDQFDDGSSATDYANGGYRILVGNTNWYNWANPYQSFTDVRVEVDVTKQTSPDGDAGIICRYVDTSNFYFLRITTDGSYAISKLVDGSETTLGAGEYTETGAVNTATGAVNHVRADCVGSSLTLYVNGTLLEQVVDSDLTSGDVGLIGGSFDIGGVDLLFDNFVVYQP